MSAGVAGYSRKNNINGTGTRIELDVEMNPETKLIAKMNFKVFFPADFPAEHKAPLHALISDCYIKRHLYTPPQVTVTIAE
ncbi:MAG: hypothetical protein ACM3ZQ_11905 [Bacillota bacterium]